MRAHNIFNVCFTITNLSDYSRDLTFIIPSPVCVNVSPSTAPPAPRQQAPRVPLAAPRPSSTSRTVSTSAIPSAFSTPRGVHSSPSTPSFNTNSPHMQPAHPLPQTPNSRIAVTDDNAVDESELLISFGDIQDNSASMLCLEKTLYVGYVALFKLVCRLQQSRLVKSNSSVSVNVRYIPLREGLFEIQGLQIFDRANDQVYEVQDTCQLYVIA